MAGHPNKEEEEDKEDNEAQDKDTDKAKYLQKRQWVFQDNLVSFHKWKNL